MRGSPALAASLACAGLVSGCSFSPPTASPDAPPEAGGDAADAMPDGPHMPACLTDPSYTTHAGFGRRYKAITEQINYDTAIDRCAADGAHLAVIDSMEESEYLRTLTGDAWIGFDDLTVEGQFRWVTGATSTFTRWNPPNEPNDNGIEDCTYFRPDGRWNDFNCQNTRRAVCECDPMYRQPPTPFCRTTPAGFVTRIGRRYFVRAAPMTWQQARADCESLDAHLLVIGDLDENTELDAEVGGAVWIGYTDTGIEGAFTWVNGAPSTFNRWPGGTIPSNDTLDCAVLQDGGAWADQACSDQLPAVCECDPNPP